MTDARTPELTRRSLFFSMAAGAALPSLLAGCNSGTTGPGTASGGSGATGVLPTYVPNALVQPDIASVSGSDPAYLSYPTNLVATVKKVPGSGGTYSTITPLWGSIPTADGNQYYAAMNKALGATVKINPANGNTYGDMLPTLLSGDKLPDWICIPGWNVTNLNFGKAVGAKFADLTPYLAGDAVKAYPNLANINTAAWKAAVWNGKLYGLPVFPSGVVVTGPLYYRKDILDARGLSEPNSAASLLAIGKELTDPKKGQWAFDDLWPYLDQPFEVPGKWAKDPSGKLVFRYETDQFYAAVDFLRSLYAAGYVHPDAAAGNNQEAKQRFVSGKTVFYGDGSGAWGEQVSSQGQSGNKQFVMQAIAPFTASGTGTPKVERGNSASMFSYVNKKLSKTQIEEVLRIADYIAAPFGSLEYTLTTYGPEGVDWTRSADGPKLTATGTKEVQPTFQFLSTAPSVTTRPGYPAFVKAYAAWQAKAAALSFEPLFFAQNITEPSQYNGIGQTVEDTIKDVVRGRKTIADLRTAVTAWRTRGGDALRSFYEKELASGGSTS